MGIAEMTNRDRIVKSMGILEMDKDRMVKRVNAVETMDIVETVLKMSNYWIVNVTWSRKYPQSCFQFSVDLFLRHYEK